MADAVKVQQLVDQVYERELTRELEDPARLRQLYGGPWVDADWREKARQITCIAAQVLKTDLCEVNLVTERTMVCFAATGMTDEREVPVGQSYCQYVVGTHAPLVVNDSNNHELVADHPATGHIQSYLGVPIGHGDQVVGALCVADRLPRNWTGAEVYLLTSLAATLVSTVHWPT